MFCSRHKIFFAVASKAGARSPGLKSISLLGDKMIFVSIKLPSIYNASTSTARIPSSSSMAAKMPFPFTKRPEKVPS